jgi:hypothetical protein
MRFLKNMRLIAAVLVVAAIATAALWPESMDVSVVRAERGPMQVTVDEDGETRVRDRFLVTAPVSGRVHRIEIEPPPSRPPRRRSARHERNDSVPPQRSNAHVRRSAASRS